MTLTVRDNPEAAEELDRMLARIRAAILAANPDTVEVAVAPPRRYGARVLDGQAQLWWTEKREGDRE